jgi:mevalonate kinase
MNQRVSIIVHPRDDTRINIDSELGQCQTDLRNPLVDNTFRFVLTAIDQHKHLLTHGFDLAITSDFSATVGLGSSAAITVAMTTAIFHLAGLEIESTQLFKDSLRTIRVVQGSGSGADAAASVFGGVLLYRFHPNQITPLQNIHPITVVYSGQKTATTEVIRLVENRRQKFPEQFAHIYSAMDNSAERAARAIQENDWRLVGELLTINQGLMSAIGVSNKRLSDIAWLLSQDTGILGAKISGSGLGDCVVGLGTMQNKTGFELLPIEMSEKGAIID